MTWDCVFPKILKHAGLTVERHADHFPHDVRDEDWLEEIARNDWVAITHNSRIRYTPNEKEVVLRHGVALLIVIGNAPFPVLAASFVATRHRIEKFLKKNRPPFIAKVYRASPKELAEDPSAPGRIERWL